MQLTMYFMRAPRSQFDYRMYHSAGGGQKWECSQFPVWRSVPAPPGRCPGLAKSDYAWEDAFTRNCRRRADNYAFRHR